MFYIKLKKTIYRKNKNKKLYHILLNTKKFISFFKIGNINTFLKKININIKLFTKLLCFQIIFKSKILYNKLKQITNFFILKKYEKFKY
jgi:hypothetical protein